MIDNDPTGPPSDDELHTAELIVAALRERLHKTPGMLDLYIENGYVRFVIGVPDRERGGTWVVRQKIAVRLFNSIYDSKNGH